MENDKTVSWEMFWGGDANHDLANEFEYLYEDTHGKSAWYWVSETQKIQTDELEGRPDEFVTCGYTSAYEAWGMATTRQAIEEGCRDFDSIFNYFKSLEETEKELKPIEIAKEIVSRHFEMVVDELKRNGIECDCGGDAIFFKANEKNETHCISIFIQKCSTTKEVDF